VLLPTGSGSAQLARMLCPARMPVSGPPRIATTNSSPPSRATSVPGGTEARSRSAIARSTSSPAAWPEPSLMVLKRSTSR
jgi:hypothetical protein